MNVLQFIFEMLLKIDCIGSEKFLFLWNGNEKRRKIVF